MTLVQRIPFSDLKCQDGKEIHHSGISSAYDRVPPNSALRYGFIEGGKALYLGRGRVLELGHSNVEQRFPEELVYEYISKDGRFLYATSVCLGKKDEHLAWDTVSNAPLIEKDPFSTNAEVALHPNGVTYAEGFRGVSHDFESVVLTNSVTGKIAGPSAKDPRTGYFVHSITQFSDDGHYLIVDGKSLINTQTFQWIASPEFYTKKKSWEEQDPGYIGDSNVFVFNRDAHWVAGGYKGGSTFLWDRLKKEYLWHGESYSLPSAFSPNDQYLLCEGKIVLSQTGKLIFDELKGKRGQFSPDGRSVVTLDDEAFYIYTLPTDSEPIFGVFQKPDPWSPPASKKSVKTPLKKATKKP